MGDNPKLSSLFVWIKINLNQVRAKHFHFLFKFSKNNLNFTLADYRFVLSSLQYLGYRIVHHHHKHQGLDPLILSVSRVTTARANVSSVFQLFSFLVVCSAMISKGFGFVAFFASVKASSVCIHLSCLVCL